VDEIYTCKSNDYGIQITGVSIEGIIISKIELNQYQEDNIHGLTYNGLELISD